MKDIEKHQHRMGSSILTGQIRVGSLLTPTTEAGGFAKIDRARLDVYRLRPRPGEFLRAHLGRRRRCRWGLVVHAVVSAAASSSPAGLLQLSLALLVLDQEFPIDGLTLGVFEGNCFGYNLRFWTTLSLKYNYIFSWELSSFTFLINHIK